ncbi:MAG: GntR family transcriptional regulator [Chloroflexota bacterium]|nr:GntR family transcriptional regulator [Chloroflexota bacterium]
MTLTPVAQRTLSDEAADRLRIAIRNGELRPGVRLVERTLAERLGMSRIPIREAIQRLAEEGLVRKANHRGTFVYAPTDAEIEEISSLRVVLEIFVAERVIHYWQAAHEARLRQIVDAMRRAATHHDLQQLYEQDYLFHSTLWEIANHNLLLEVVSGLRSRINRFLHEAVEVLSVSQLDMHIASHDALIEVLKSGDVAQARIMFTNHVLDARNRILVYCALPDQSGLK